MMTVMGGRYRTGVVIKLQARYHPEPDGFTDSIPFFSFNAHESHAHL